MASRGSSRPVITYVELSPRLQVSQGQPRTPGCRCPASHAEAGAEGTQRPAHTPRPRHGTRSSPGCLPHLTLLVTGGGIPAAGELPSSVTRPAATGRAAQTTAGKHGSSQHTNRAGKPGCRSWWVGLCAQQEARNPDTGDSPC